MSEVVIRQVQGEEAASILHMQTSYAFQASPPLPRKEEWIEKNKAFIDNSRHHALFEDGRPLVSASCISMSQNVRGQIYPETGGISGVVSHPEGRRKGYARQIVSYLFRDMYEREMPFSTLYAFRETFYVRLGFTVFPHSRVVKFAPRPLVPLLKQPLEGHVEMYSIADGFEKYRAYLCKRQSAVHGMAVMIDGAMRGMRQSDLWFAIAYVGDEPRGIMTYKIHGYKSIMEVPRFYYDDAAGRYLLLEWFARHMDQVNSIEVRVPAFELPETWYPDLDIQLSVVDPPLGRVIDIKRIGGMQVGEGQFTARISDPQCPWNEGIYRFVSRDGVLAVEAGGEAECELGIQAISALVWGAHEPETFVFKGWGNPSTEVQETMRRMFPPMVPHLHANF